LKKKANRNPEMFPIPSPPGFAFGFEQETGQSAKVHGFLTPCLACTGMVAGIIFLPYITFGRWDARRKKILLCERTNKLTGKQTNTKTE
jgi:hypothetical protein